MKQTPLFATMNVTSKNLYNSSNLLSTGSMAGASVHLSKQKGIIVNKEKEYTEFLSEILKRVEEKYEGKVKGEICHSVKNNGVLVTGLLLKGEEKRVAPSFYLEQQFSEWTHGRCSLEEITKRLCETYEEEVKRSSHLVSEIKFEWEEFRRNVFMRLVNKEKNKELLNEIPHQEFMDLALLFYYSVPISGGMLGTLIITKEHLGILNISEEELYQAAKSNCERFRPAKVCCMEEVVCDLAKKLGVDVQEACSNYPFLYVLTNSSGMFGAVAMIFEEELESFSKRINNSFYVLPSSVHEVILVPACKEFCVEYFAAMVREINETQVDPTEVLSDSIYYYDKNLKRIRRVA